MAIEKRISKNNGPRYKVKVRDELGKWFPAKAFSTLRDAQKNERCLKEKREAGILALSEEARSITVENYLSKWVEYRSTYISGGWNKAKLRIIHLYILPIIGGLKLSEVKPPHIGKILSEMKKKGLSSSYQIHTYMILQQSFRDAVEYYEYLEKNPMKKQDKPKMFKVKKNFLKPEEAYRLLDACKDHYIGPAVHLGILVGLRLSEIQALRWSSVDFEKNQILICEAYKSSINKMEPYPKQKDWLIVPIPKMLSEYLRAQKAQSPRSFVAPALKGGMLFNDKLRLHLKNFCKKIGVPKVSAHELRHSCSEVWFSHGASVEDVRRLLGHKSASTTMNYVHRTEDRLAKLAESIQCQ